jgi:hypothetical protein
VHQLPGPGQPPRPDERLESAPQPRRPPQCRTDARLRGRVRATPELGERDAARQRPPHRRAPPATATRPGQAGGPPPPPSPAPEARRTPDDTQRPVSARGRRPAVGSRHGVAPPRCWPGATRPVGGRSAHRPPASGSG